MTNIREIAHGLRFPEGPIALPDGDVLLVEIARGTLSRVKPDGRVEVVAETGGGPNGAAMGPDGKVYVTSQEGKISVLKAGPEWEVMAVNDIGEDINATPALANGRLYVRTGAAVYCFTGPRLPEPSR